MNYILVNNGGVINGPRPWNYRSFESSLTEDLEITFKLPMRYVETSPIIIDEYTKIVTCEYQYPVHDSRLQYLHGPFWNFDNDIAIGTFQVMDIPIDNIRFNMKQRLADNRWRREVAGVTVNVQNISVTIDTSRDGRNIFVQKFILMAENETVQWKFPQSWLTLTKEELGTVVSAGAAHIQKQFEWESVKNTEIDLCNDPAALILIDIGDQDADISQLPENN